MSALRRLALMLLASGGVSVASALIWYGLTFWPPVGNHYLSLTEAGRCLVSDSSLCRLATSLCSARHAALVIAYSPILLWTGAATIFCGLTVFETGGATGRSRQSMSDLVSQRVQLPIDGGSHLGQGPVVENLGD